MKILVKVTKDVLRQSMYCAEPGTDECKTSCAFAVAIRDLFPAAQVYQGHSELLGGVFQWDESMLETRILDRANHPPLMTKYIQSFDKLSPEQRLELPEVAFEIEVPEYVLNKIGISEAYRVLSESKTLELISI